MLTCSTRISTTLILNFFGLLFKFSSLAAAPNSLNVSNLNLPLARFVIMINQKKNQLTPFQKSREHQFIMILPMFYGNIRFGLGLKFNLFLQIIMKITITVIVANRGTLTQLGISGIPVSKKFSPRFPSLE